MLTEALHEILAYTLRVVLIYISVCVLKFVLSKLRSSRSNFAPQNVQFLRNTL